ncbi:MAG: hypothetical protein ACI87E_005234 [Mariniblastus sp.]
MATSGGVAAAQAPAAACDPFRIVGRFTISGCSKDPHADDGRAAGGGAGGGKAKGYKILSRVGRPFFRFARPKTLKCQPLRQTT